MPAFLRLTCLNGNLKGQRWEVFSYARVGRNADVEVCLPDVSVSRTHAVIDGETEWRATDLRSSNGTYLNGIRLGSGQAGSGGTRSDSVLIQDRDVLHFGKVAMMIEVRSEAERAPVPVGPPLREFDPDALTRPVAPTKMGQLQGTTAEEIWFAARTRHPGFLPLVRVGDFFETFHDDAERVAGACGLPLLHGRGKRCRIPAKALDKSLDQLMYRNLRAVVCDRFGEIRVGEPQECLAPALHESCTISNRPNS